MSLLRLIRKEGQSSNPKKGVILVSGNMCIHYTIYLITSNYKIYPTTWTLSIAYKSQLWSPLLLTHLPAIQHTLIPGPRTTPSTRLLSWILLYAAVYALFEPLIATRIFGNWKRKGWHDMLSLFFWEMVKNVEVLWWLVVPVICEMFFLNFSQKHSLYGSSFNIKPHHIQPITVTVFLRCFSFRWNFWHQICTTELRSWMVDI